MQPGTKYAWLGPDRIAYQVLGDGPPDQLWGTDALVQTWAATRPKPSDTSRRETAG
jgi:hypothetical protein